MTAGYQVLFAGYILREPGLRIASTVSFVHDGHIQAIIDPGMVPASSTILRALAGISRSPEQITDVVLSHHHPDHTMNVALFPNARVHDFWAIYRNDVWESRPAEGFSLSPSIQLIETPGHTPQDVTTLAATQQGTVAFTHLWWHAQAADDPSATDPDALHRNRLRVLELATWIIPGHGAPFKVTAATPR